jgi:carbamoyltransferase
MRVLGISGRHRDAAAALAVDGQVVAAASEDAFTGVSRIGYGQTGGFPAQAVDACLATAGIERTQIDCLTVVDDGAGPAAGLGHADRRVIDPLYADAAQAAWSGAGAVLVCGSEPPAMALCVQREGRLGAPEVVTGGDDMLSAARQLALALGVDEDDPYRSLDRLSVGGEPEFQDDLAKRLQWHRDAVQVDRVGLAEFLRSVSSAAGTLSDAASLNVRLQAKRRSLAASFTRQAAQVIHGAAESLTNRAGASSLAFGGSLFANSRFRTDLQSLTDRLVDVAPVPEPAGRALGAALASFTKSQNPQITKYMSLSLGPSFSDTDIKRTLDNCRLDYVYEPDWQRLYARISRMLSQGKVVAWFQGAMAFGPRSMGSRSILCDPSGRYARNNMNEYLRQTPLDEPLPLVFAPSAVAACVASPAASAFSALDTVVDPKCRESLAAALDSQHRARVHTVTAAQAPQLCDLLEAHLKNTGVPALIETNLGEPGPTACTPRDAIRTVYSSAIDALVMGRFFLMKDHWLLRSNAG